MNIEPDVEYNFMGLYEGDGELQIDIDSVGVLYLYESGVMVLRDHTPDDETLN